MEENLEFDFEKLEVYQLSLEFIDFIFIIYKQLPNHLRYNLGDNLIRAGVSVSNNIAEGSGKRSSREKSRYYGTSLDPTREVINMFIILMRQKAVGQQDYIKARNYGKRLTSMLFRLIGSCK